MNGQINNWFAQLTAMAIRPLLSALAETLLATPDIEGQPRIHDLWQASAVLANSGFVVLVIAAGVMVMGHGTVQTRYAIKEVLPRLVVAFGAANFSLFFTIEAVRLANGVSLALLGQDFDAARATNAIRTMILPYNDGEIFYVLLALVAVILLILLLITFMFRIAMTILLVIVAPLALACLALPHTDGAARLWGRAFTGLLLIQIGQSLTLVAAVRIFFNQDGRQIVGLTLHGQLYNLLIALCLLIILVRIPGWVSRTVFTHRGRGSTIARIVKYAIAYRLASPILSTLHLGRGRSGRKTATATAMTGRALPAMAGAVAGTAAAATGIAGTAAVAARGGSGPFKHAPVGARRPPQQWAPTPIKHAPTGPPMPGKYRPTPNPPGPVPATTPVYGYPRETYYARGPAGLGQMYHLRNQSTATPPKATGGTPVRPIVAPGAPIPGTPEWPENHGEPRRKPPARRKGGDKR
ncbi:hypothetical protein DP939_22405 [Spongiactinospora rosea]|uniref:TrbL/VirB6 plasmid conjugal transfer protein n=1 Tax=Spongiactinospora rosea TaxID=2248750 RepID=A0A366LW22_9ACTN|nr:hypothetical protein [Spongiactinospora rosea]RBQ18111.1 hypothetical protein DP939_22405 [Spongiactinospora rosea]